MVKRTTVQFIEESIAVHGDRYDYSKSEYTLCKNKIIITCKEHGDINITADHHINGGGCTVCSGWRKREKTSLVL